MLLSETMAGKKILVAVFLATILVGLTASKIKADDQYGNGDDHRQIILDKKTKPNAWDTWYDNLSVDKHVFIASDKVDYRIAVKNSGDEELTKVKVVDILPEDIHFLTASEGYTHNGREVKWEIEKLAKGEEKIFYINGQLADSNALSGKGNFCTDNHAWTQAESGHGDGDWAEICVESRVLGASVLPEAGVNLGIGALIGLITAGFGTFLTKFKIKK